MRKIICFIAMALVIAGRPGAAAPNSGSSDEAATRAYIYLKQNTDLFVGEGVAELKEFEGDSLKAMAAARERAKAALADTVKVRIQSTITETAQSKDGTVSEDLKSESKSQADVSLENVKYLELKDYPGSGKCTVLASLSKEDYRRQMAGKKTKVYLPENGISFNIGELWLNSVRPALSDSQMRPSYLVANPGLYSESTDGHPPVVFGLNLIWQHWVAELNYSDFQVLNDPVVPDPGPAGRYSVPQPSDLKLFLIAFGYDWTPYAWRLQPFLPLRVEYDVWAISPSSGYTLGVSGGLGLRYWVNDAVALQFLGRWHQGLLDGQIPETVSGSGFESTASLVLSTF